MKDAKARVPVDEKRVPCSEGEFDVESGEVRLSPHAELIRDRLEMRLEKLAEISPKALDVAASALAVLHDRLNGKIKRLAADHTAEYAGQMIRGDKVLGLTRLCYMLDEETDAVLDALQEIVAPYGGMIVRIPTRVRDIQLESADLSREFGEFQSHVCRPAGPAVLTGAGGECSAREILPFSLHLWRFHV